MPVSKRDGGRCVVTGEYNKNEIKRLPPHQRALHITCTTEAAHIIPFALGTSVVRLLFFYNEESQKFYNQKKAKSKRALLILIEQSNQAARIWDMLYRCFLRVRAILAFGPENINDPANAFTIMNMVYDNFGNFRISFEATVSTSSF